MTGDDPGPHPYDRPAGGVGATGRGRRAAALLLAVCAVLAALLGGAAPASAHAVLDGSDPAADTVLDAAPARITLSFTEDVRLPSGALRVIDPANRRVDTGAAGHADGDGSTARIALADDLPDGTYTVAWRVVSADSHPISGAFTFSVGAPSAPGTLPGLDLPGTPAATGRAYDVNRYLAYAGYALFIGVGAFALVCWPAGLRTRALRGLLAAGWSLLVLSAVALLALRGPFESGGGLGGAFDAALLRQTLEGRPGRALLLRLVLLVLAGLACAAAAARAARAAGPQPGAPQLAAASAAPAVRPAAVGAGALLAVGLAGTWAAVEHASVGDQVPLAVTAAGVHLLAMAVWLGGLAALLTALSRGGGVPREAVERFSALAFGAVAVLVATGVYQAWREIGGLDALTGTAYGRLLLWKLAAAALLLTAAYASRGWTARLRQAPAGARAEDAGEPGTAQRPEPERGGRGREDARERREPVAATAARSGTAARTAAGAPPAGSGTAGTGTPGPEAADTDPARPPAPDAQPPGTGAPATRPPAPVPPDERRGLRRSVAVEAVLALVVLGLTTALTGTQPARAAEEGARAARAAAGPPLTELTIPFDVGTPGGTGKVNVTLEPGRVGRNSVQAVVLGPDDGLATVPEVRVAFTHAGQGIGPLDARLRDVGGYWAADDVRIPLPGTWTMKVTVRTSDVDQVTVRREVDVRGDPGAGGGPGGP